jgi:DNA-binding NarL/FixJ family response regulator
MKLLIFTPICLFGEALAAALKDLEEVECVQTCGLLCELPDRVRELEPEILLFDVTEEEALAEARMVSLACPALYMIALSLPEVPKAVISCVDAGFAAYVPRQASIGQLRRVLVMAQRGETSCHPQVVAGLVTELRRRRREEAPSNGELLTRREAEVLSLLGRGLSNKEIARSLNVSISTVKAHVHSLLTKLQTRSRGEAIARLRTHPWLERSA